jgi:hypothetical protein
VPAAHLQRLRDGQAGSSAITSVFGVAIFLGFLLLATQTLVHLYATSVVTSVAFDEARRASGFPPSCAGVEQRVRDRLGRFGTSADVVTCARPADGVDGQLVVTVGGPSPARGLSWFPGPSAADRI